MVPSAVTMFAICAGVSAIKFALDGNVNFAVTLIAVSAVFDGLDGRIARKLGATSKIGAELDSLADAIDFGVAPAIVVYALLLSGNDAGWMLVLLYCCAIVLRLARFNTLIDDPNAPAYTKDFFVGVPAPAAALLAIAPLALQHEFGDGWWTSSWFVGGWLVFVAALAASRIPTASFKTVTVPSKAVVVLLLGAVVAGALLFTYPYAFLLAAAVGYLGHIPFAAYNLRWVAARPETWEYRPAQRRAERRKIRQVRRMAPAGRGSTARLGLRRPEE